MNKNRPVIIHLDLDAFFASCEERENPQFRGKPIVVGADPKDGTGRGVVATANYEARKFGIHSALPISQAWRLCPDAIFLPTNSALYLRVSRSVMKILEDAVQKHSGKFKQVSIDEAYLNPAGSDPVTLAKKIKQKIFDQEKITASVGVGPSMLVAKIASDFQKPNGLTVVKPEGVKNFLDPLNIRKIPGIGPKTESELKKLKIETVAALRAIPQSILYDKFGQHGISLYESARGIDRRTLAEEAETKSISEEYTFEKDTDSAQEILPIFFSLVKNVLRTTQSDDYKNFKTITIKIRYSDFKTHTKSLSDKFDIREFDNIEKVSLKLLWPFLSSSKKIRLIGFRVSGF